MSYKMDGKKYWDTAEIRLYCDELTRTKIWEFIKQGLLPEPIYPEQPYWAYFEIETIKNFVNKHLK